MNHHWNLVIFGAKIQTTRKIIVWIFAPKQLDSNVDILRENSYWNFLKHFWGRSISKSFLFHIISNDWFFCYRSTLFRRIVCCFFILYIMSMSPCKSRMAMGNNSFSGSPVVSTSFSKGPKFSSNFFLMSLSMQVWYLAILMHFLYILIFTHCSGIDISSKIRWGKDWAYCN